MKTIRLILFIALFVVFNPIRAEQPPVTVTTVKVFDIKSDQAKSSFSIQGKVAGERGVCFSQSSNPVVTGKKSAAPGNYSNGNSMMMGLKAGTTYYVRAYVKNGSEVIYGNELNFTTLTEADKPSTGNTGKKVEKKESNTSK